MSLRCAFCILFLPPCSIAAAAPKTVIITSDAGAVLDDTWAIAYILQDPDVDVKLVVSDTRHTKGKAQFLQRTLLSLGRPDIAVFAGVPTSPTLVYDNWKRCCNGTCSEVGCEDGFFVGPAAQWHPADVGAYEQPIESDGVEAMAKVVQRAQGIVDILVLSPLTNMGAFVGRYPELVPHVRITAMAGSIDVGYKGDYGDDSNRPDAEYNILLDVDAAQQVLSAPWAGISLAPLDTTRKLQLVGPLYQEVLGTRGTQLTSKTILSQYEEQIKPCLANHSVWCPANGPYDTPQNASSTLYDLQAAFMLSVDANPFEGHGLHIETLRLSVNATGFTVRDDDAGRPVNVSLKWLPDGEESFYDHVVQRLVRTGVQTLV